MTIDTKALQAYEGISSVNVKRSKLSFSFKDTSYELLNKYYDPKRKTLTLYIGEQEYGLLCETPVYTFMTLPKGLVKIVIKAEKIKTTSF